MSMVRSLPWNQLPVVLGDTFKINADWSRKRTDLPNCLPSNGLLAYTVNIHQSFAYFTNNEQRVLRNQQVGSVTEFPIFRYGYSLLPVVAGMKRIEFATNQGRHQRDQHAHRPPWASAYLVDLYVDPLHPSEHRDMLNDMLAVLFKSSVYYLFSFGTGILPNRTKSHWCSHWLKQNAKVV